MRRRSSPVKLGRLLTEDERGLLASAYHHYNRRSTMAYRLLRSDEKLRDATGAPRTFPVVPVAHVRLADGREHVYSRGEYGTCRICEDPEAMHPTPEDILNMLLEPVASDEFLRRARAGRQEGAGERESRAVSSRAKDCVSGM